MAEPWFRMHANGGKINVTRRLMKALGVKRAAAVGYLAMFWGGASQHCPDDGCIIDVPDTELEEWAGWDGPRGKFAAFIREKHTDKDGRIREWDEYCGALAIQRLKSRLRQSNRRTKLRTEQDKLLKQLADSHANGHGDSHGDNGDDDNGDVAGRHHARAETIRDDTSTPPPPPPRARSGELTELIGRVLKAVPMPDLWGAEIEACLDGMPGHPAVTDEQAIRGLKDFLANGAARNASLRQFRRYLHSARDEDTQPRRIQNGGRVRNGKPAPDYSNAVTDEGDIVWAK